MYGLWLLVFVDWFIVWFSWLGFAGCDVNFVVINSVVVIALFALDFDCCLICFGCYVC